MIGVQFVEVGTEAAKSLADSMTLNSAMSGFDDGGSFATEMMVWKNNDYTTYGWAGSSGTDVIGDSSLDNKWLNDELEEDDEAFLAAHDAVWIKAEKAGTVIVSGEVPTNTVVTVPLAVGYNMVANPFPKSVKVANFGVLSANMAGFDDGGSFATEMMVWKDGNYATYGWAGSSGTDVIGDSSLDNKWLNDELEEDDEAYVDFGHGVWIKAASAGTITFTAE